MLDLSVKLTRGDQAFQECRAGIELVENQLTQRTAQSFAPAPAIKTFGAGVPNRYPVSRKIPNDDGIVRPMDDVGQLTREIVRSPALSHVVHDPDEMGDRTAFGADRRNGMLVVKETSIFPAVCEFAAPGLAGENRLPQIAIEGLVVFA